ncbi:hypothetical protein BH18VER1_BH18VER1_21130 [soil metagenome]
MRPDKFTQKRQEALQAAQDLASQHNHAEIGNEHFLTALLDQREGVTRPLLEKVGVTAKGLRDRLEQGLDRLPTDSFGRAGVELRRIAKRRPWRDVRHLRVRNVAEVPRSRATWDYSKGCRQRRPGKRAKCLSAVIHSQPCSMASAA